MFGVPVEFESIALHLSASRKASVKRHRATVNFQSTADTSLSLYKPTTNTLYPFLWRRLGALPHSTLPPVMTLFGVLLHNNIGRNRPNFRATDASLKLL